ncbi:Retinol dehydrogenase 11 [Fasciola gigantica]|uniref:Retinol dehydrogenase 11 n=1 Tax=Fasciola gigantica TaxID=46835 RepID=A0A504Z266_FASGI|nr:Retinol dehydrogenase 11 [Fasciola gigantica]
MSNWSTACWILVGTGSFCLIMLRWLSRQSVTCTCVAPVLRHAVITGATSGIGRSTAFELARRSWKLTLGCRSLDAAGRLVEEIATMTGNRQVSAKHLDLIEPDSVSRFANSFPGDEVDVLINNAGVMATSPRPVDAFGGLNIDTVTNYLGPFYLTQLMIPKMKSVVGRSPCPRIIFVSSSLAKRGCVDKLLSPHIPQMQWNISQAYADSKLAVCLFARELYRRFGVGDNKSLDVYCLFTGGMVHTNLNSEILSKYPTLVQRLLRLISGLFLKSPAEGCQCVVHCAVSDDVVAAHSTSPTEFSMHPSGSGLLYRNCIPIPWPETIPNAQQEDLLWKQTMQFLNLKDV